MRAVVIDSPGGTIAIHDVAEPAPGPGDVLVDVAYCGGNFADMRVAKGTYAHPKGYPFIGGFEIAGRVARLGANVAGVEVGETVAAFSDSGGGFADRCVIPASRLIRVPASMSIEAAAAFPIQALTAWHMLHTVSAIAPGETLLMHAIGGGVGLHVTQLAVRAGAVVFGTVGTSGSETRAFDYGATHVVNRQSEDFVAAMMRFTGNRGVDKVFDSTGATILDRSFDAVRKLGHVVSIGEAEGRPLPTLWERLVPKSLTFTRFHLGHLDPSSEAWRRGIDDVLDGATTGWLRMPISTVFAFRDFARLYALLGTRGRSGKLILAINP